MSFHQHFGFSSKFYASYSQRAQTVFEKTNIFYLIMGNVVEILSFKAVVVQVLFVLL